MTSISPSGGVRDAARERGSRLGLLRFSGWSLWDQMEKGYILVVDRVYCMCWGWKTFPPRFILWGVYIIKHEIRIPTKQPRFNGKYEFFFSFFFRGSGIRKLVLGYNPPQAWRLLKPFSPLSWREPFTNFRTPNDSFVVVFLFFLESVKLTIHLNMIPKFSTSLFFDCLFSPRL